MKPRWRVVLVDDHAPSRAAVAEAVGSAGGLIVGAGTSSEEARALVERHRPDAVILAVGLPAGDGVDRVGIRAARHVDKGHGSVPRLRRTVRGPAAEILYVETLCFV